MRKILITGANGFLGFYLSRLLLQQGFAVLATGKGEKRHQLSNPAYSYKTLDFTNEEQVKIVLEEERPDAVVHAGAISKPDVCEQQREAAYRINVTGTLNLLKHAGALQAHFIFLSTDFVFSGHWNENAAGFYREGDDRLPVNYYGETKQIAEDAVMKANTLWSIVRTATVYGKPVSDRDNLVSNVANALNRKEPVTIFHDQVRTPTYVEDLAQGICSIIQKKAGGIYHIAGEEVWTLYEMAIATAGYLQKDKSLVKKIVEGDIQQAARRPGRTCLDISKAKKELNYSPTSLADGLKKMFE